MKTHKIKYSLIFMGICASFAYAQFIPNPVILETSEGVKPKIMLILDNSGSMIIASRTPTHPTASWMSRSEILYDSVIYLADRYEKNADFGISILNQQPQRWEWPAALNTGQVINQNLLNIYGNSNPDSVMNYSAYYGWLSNHNSNNWFTNWSLQTMTAKNAGIIMNIADLEQPANMNNFKRQVREIGPYNGTPLGTAITTVRNYFAANSANPRPIQYRCQKNHILMFTDGNANAGDEPAPSARIAWDTNYLPSSGLDAANKPWRSNGVSMIDGVAKQNISFHGIYFGPEMIGAVENPAFTNLKAAAIPSNGMVVNADSLDSLKAAFAKIINSIVITRSGTGGTFGAEDPLNLTNDNKNDIFYSTSFGFKDWTGTIDAKRPDKSILWSSTDTIKFMNEAGAGAAGSQHTVFKTLSGAATVDIAANGVVTANHIDWLKGKNINTLRARSVPLSDIIGSKATYAGKGLSLISGDLAVNSSSSGANINWENYKTEKNQHYTSRLLFGSNDGLFNLIDPVTGYRKYAFLPPSMLPRVADVADPNYVHSFGIDGETTVADAGINSGANTIAVAGYGAGGKGYFAVRLFCASNACGGANRDKPEILWEVKDGPLGYTYGNAHIVRTNNAPNHDVIVANGYDAPSKQTSLLRYSTLGNLQNEYVTKNTDGTPYLDGGGLSTPEIITDSKGFLMYAYAGDLKGNLWKFDFTGGYSNSQVKIFKLFTDIGGKPITTKPLIVKRGNNLIIVFGSGKYLEQTDRTGENEKALHHVYGILDNNSNVFITKEDLQAQNMIASVVANSFDVSSNDVDYSEKKGWYLPLVINPSNPEGDRLIYNPTLSGSGAYSLVHFPLASYANIPSTDPCLTNDANLTGKTLQLYPFSGGMPVGDVAGSIIPKPTGATEVRHYDSNGNILNVSKVTIEKPDGSNTIDPDDPNSSGFGETKQLVKDQDGNDKNIAESIGTGNDTDGKSVTLKNMFDPEDKPDVCKTDPDSCDPCKVYPDAANCKIAAPQRIYLRTRF